MTRRAAASQPWFELNAPRDEGPSRAWDIAGWAMAGAVALVLGWIAFRLHIVGDYSTESDFYGGYAAGARLIQSGRVDPARYVVVGPGYDFALAVLGFVVRDLFTAARLISVASAAATLLLWRSLLRPLAGSGAAFWTIAFLGINATFLRYGYSATTDMLAIALQAATLHSVLAPAGRRAPLRSGILAALATLTRYNSVFLLPLGVACYTGLAPAPGTGRRRAIAMLLSGFALVAVPWTAFSLAGGHVPGGSLFRQFGSFYTVDDFTRNVQDQLPGLADSLATPPGRAAGGLVLQTLRNVPDHLRRDAMELLGLPVAVLCVAGIALALRDGRWRRLMPVWVGGALLFATLAPVFYSDRYSLAIAPAYLTLAGAALSSRLLAARIRPGGIHLKWLAGLVVLVYAAGSGLGRQLPVLLDQPVEVIAAGRAIAADSRPTDRVMSRKGQIGYYAGREVVPFPRVGTLPELGDYSRRAGARYLYYSWYEARVRPEFVYLLDTTATVPGLTVVYQSRTNPGVAYRIGPEFGRIPGWFANRYRVRLHLARAHVQYLPAAEAAPSHVFLAEDALNRQDPATALGHLDQAMEGVAPVSGTWRLRGEAQRALGRMGEAIDAYQRAVVLDPADTLARLGLGWAQLGNGNVDLAARAWRPAIGPRVDTFTLREMVRIYDTRGDREAAAAARAELARRGERE